MTTATSLRIRCLNGEPYQGSGDYVLYWMIAYRRLDSNFALERAVEIAHEVGKPLLILEALRVGYPWASDRLHRFVLDGMADHARRLDGGTVGYYPYVEPNEGAGKGLLEALAKRAVAVVTDDFPCFFLPRMVDAAAGKLSIRLEAVDSNGLLPLRAAEKVFSRAYDMRRFVQRTLPDHLGDFPREHPLVGHPLPRFPGIPEEILARWPPASAALMGGHDGALAELPIDHAVRPAPLRGGPDAAGQTLQRFLDERLRRYNEDRNQPMARATSELSPYLHFGHISVHQVFTALVEAETWNPGKLGDERSGARRVFWGMSAEAEAFLDQLVTWRELGFNMTSRRDDYAEYDSLPDWARATLAEHASDERPEVYDLENFEAAATDSELWNAAQRQLVEEGVIHNYMRMVWGKKILHWSPSPRQALDWMLHLNNKYGLDGRNPNSYSGIFWCLGRYDRAWGPERPIFGKIRYMSLASTRRKLDAKAYVKRYGTQGQLGLV